MKGSCKSTVDDLNLSLLAPVSEATWNTQSWIAPNRDFSRRVEVMGKFLYLGKEKFWVKGITYGTFSPNPTGDLFPMPEQVASDFRAMAMVGINTVRVYTPPPCWLLDLAQEYGLRLIVGLAWSQHVTFLDNKELVESILQGVRNDVLGCKSHPAILAYSVGNEIPANIVRWHGRHKVEAFIKRLYETVKKADPGVLVTYVNYPSTEYLQLQFLDICCFNLYLESEDDLTRYLSRLQNVAGNKPLLMAEIGLDSQRNGEEKQAQQLRSQIRNIFAAGCSGTVIFAWTDEWFRGGHEVEDWDFGLVRRDRHPKKALAAVLEAYRHVPFDSDIAWPKISVVVCSFNGEATIRDTLDGLASIDYPDYEVIVVNDGSTDKTAKIAAEYEVRLISTENNGLSNARNTGWQLASGEIIAYIDDDAYPDQHWLKYLAYTYLTTDFVAVGGQSPAPAGDGFIADCVANAPGRPVHVLVSDVDAEHIPGCNMSFKRSALEELDGFDPVFRTAGDDVDICWRVLERGWRVGYQAAAVNWHHCRNSIKVYMKQQKGYGKAEALLERKWPEKYNSAGHLTWKGRIYSNVYSEFIPFRSWRIYQGYRGTAPFQSIYTPQGQFWTSLPLMPEWLLVIGLLAFLSVLGLAWQPLTFALPLLILSLMAPALQALVSGWRAQSQTPHPRPWQRVAVRATTSLLFLMQPAARLRGRLQFGLTPWRRRLVRVAPFSGALKSSFSLWNEKPRHPTFWIDQLEKQLNAEEVILNHGGEFDAWDLEIRAGLFGSARILMTQEDHGSDKQLVRFKIGARISKLAMALIMMLVPIAMIAIFDGAAIVGGALLTVAAMTFFQFRYEALGAIVAFSEASKPLERMVENDR